MSKQESLEMKGIAILLMLFLHLFLHESDALLCYNVLYIKGTPLVHLMTRMANPVPFYVILSGYGLYATYKKGDKHRWSRLGNLILHYWLILLIFVTIGAFIVPMKYPGTIFNVIENLTAFNTTYNSEQWFLFPYLLLAVSAPFFFKLCDRYNSLFILGVSYLIYLGACFLISRYGEMYLYSHMFVYHPILYGSMLFDFLLGAIAYKNNWLRRHGNRNYKKWTWLLLILLSTFRCFFETGAFHNWYVFVFIWIWSQIVRPQWLKAFFMHMGKHSMNMWLIHSFFCYHIFHDWIYSFRYPLVIYGVLLVVSYLSSCVVNMLYGLGEKGFVIASKQQFGQVQSYNDYE